MSRPKAIPYGHTKYEKEPTFHISCDRKEPEVTRNEKRNPVAFSYLGSYYETDPPVSYRYETVFGRVVQRVYELFRFRVTVRNIEEHETLFFWVISFFVSGCP